MVLLCSLFSAAQQSVTTAANQVPPLIPFASVATDQGGSSLSGVVNITFSLYAAQQGGEPLWTETQNNIQLDATGHYSVQLGITKPNGMPTALFTTTEARWLGVQIAEQGEQPRVLLLSVPYALKAGDAATIGGLPPSAFVLAAAAPGSAQSAPQDASATSAPPPNAGVTGLGTVGYIPMWDTTSDIVDSVLFQSATSPYKIGIGNPTPAATLDVAGSSIVRGTFELPNTGAATATAGKNSQPFAQIASAFNSTTAKAVNQTFEWQAEPAGNDTATASATLNLLFGSGTTKPAETGLNIASTGQINFAAGQTFPGAGTITGITTATGSGLTGGASSGTSTLSLLKTCATNQVLQWNGTDWTCATVGGGGSGTVTSVATGLGLKGGPITTSGTLTIDTTVVPQLAAANTFTANQTVNGILSGTSNAFGVAGSATAGSGFSVGVAGTAASPAGYGVEGVNTGSGGIGVYGYDSAGTGVSAFGVTGVSGNSESPSGYGLEGVNSAGSGNAIGVYGTGTTGVSGSGTSYGVSGTSAEWGVSGTSTSGVPYGGVMGSGATGVKGYSGSGSVTGENFYQAGIWGDSGNYAVLGTNDEAVAGYFINNDPSGSFATMIVENNTTATHNAVFETSSPNTYGGSRHCTIDTSANLTCTGVLTGVVKADDGKETAIYAMQSAENWLEDAGSGQLANGSVRIELDPAFAQTVNAGVEYHVFLTPNGDSKGLFVSQKTATSFEVHEQGGGTSSIAFDYRIMAKRKGYENVRLEDLTGRFKQHAPTPNTRHTLPAAAPQVKALPPTPLVPPTGRPVAMQSKVSAIGR